MRLIRKKVANDRKLLGYNISYGFKRNLIGGAVFGFIVLMLLSVYAYMFDITNMLRILVTCGGVEIVYIVYSLIFIKLDARAYANELFSAYEVMK